MKVNNMVKRVLLTGASSGLGKAIMRYLSKRQFEIIGVSRNLNDSSEFNSSISWLKADLSQSSEIARIADFVSTQPFDIAIHCLGGGLGMHNPSLSIEEFDALMRINFFAAYHINNSLINSMKKRKKGWIVHLDTVATREITASLGYTCAKSLIKPYVKHLGRSMIEHNIFLSSIQLGAMTGDGGAMDRLNIRDSYQHEEFIKRRRPSKRMTPNDEIMPYIALLISPSARLHAGNTMVLDESELHSIY
jgi:NAD(P)-dependent dehydrogenase (short-subunit alcohol dehydrogenase family)